MSVQIPQTTYNEFPKTLLNGMVTKNGPKSIESRRASGFVTVGAFCLMGPGDDQCKAIPDGTATLGGEVLGMAAYDAARSPYSTVNATSGGSGQYADGEEVPALRKGKGAMYCENAATAGNPVFVRCTAAGADVTGQVRDGAAVNFVQHPTAVFMSSTTGAGVALVEVK